MKFVQYCTRPNSWGKYYNFISKRVIRVLEMNPARTLTTSAVTADVTLYGRLLPVGDPKISIVPILDQWIKEERVIELEELRKIIKQFRKYRRIKHALQVLRSLFFNPLF